ncbi:MAG: LOG family protein [Candidatus Paceibacterota bacterium]|jgi:hypothetical protein
MKKAVVFAGIRYPQEKQDYYLNLAYQTGKILAQKNFIVISGSGSGLMEAVLKGAVEAGGRTVGVALNLEGRNPSSYAQEVFCYDRLTDRQQKLIELGDVFIALPGGIGTLHEICDVIVQKKLKLIPFEKKLILVGDYYKNFCKLLNGITNDGFTNIPLENFFQVINCPEEIDQVI